MSESQVVAASLMLAVILVLAVREDLISHRIPNALTLTGLALGVALHTYGGGLPGFGWSVAGAAVGLACFLPFYLCKGMGAGDVKLMMAVGAFLGPLDAVAAVMLCLVAGAVLAVLVMIWRIASSAGSPEMAAGGASASRLRSALARATAERFPYAAAIAAGVFATMWLRGLLSPLAEAVS